MLFKKLINCARCSYIGKAFVVKTSWIERLALIGLIVFSILLPTLLVYTVPLILIDLFMPAIQICPDCKHVEFKSADEPELAPVRVKK